MVKKNTNHLTYHVPQDKYFVLNNGRVLKCLQDFILVLEDLDEEVFKHHVNEFKNDFSNWIEFVLNDSDLAASLKGMATREEMLNHLKEVFVDELRILTEPAKKPIGKEESHEDDIKKNLKEFDGKFKDMKYHIPKKEKSSKNSLFAFLSVVAFFLIAELILNFSQPESMRLKYGFIVFALGLTAGIFVLLFAKLREEFRLLLSILMILPLLRVIEVSIPLLDPLFNILGIVPPYFFYRIALMYPIILGIVFINVHYLKIDIKKYHTSKYLKYLPLVLIPAAFLALLEFFIAIRTYSGFELPITAATVTIPILILAFFATMLSGYTEELLFRGLIQQKAKKMIGVWGAIFFTSLLFGLMHMGWSSGLFRLYEILFAFAAAIFLGYLFEKTQNIWLVASLHGILNFLLFAIYPLVF